MPKANLGVLNMPDQRKVGVSGPLCINAVIS